MGVRWCSSLTLSRLSRLCYFQPVSSSPVPALNVFCALLRWCRIQSLAPNRLYAYGPFVTQPPRANQGGRAHLSKLFARHVRNTISKHRAVAQRGGDPDQMRDIQVRDWQYGG